MERFLRDFDCISVREFNTMIQLNKHFSDLNIETMPDPVLLLSSKIWTKLLVRNKTNEKYILAYFLGHDIRQRNQIVSYAKSRNMQLKFVSHIDWNDYKWETDNKECLTGAIGIPEFLSLIANAALVITDSFHGTIFSAIFNTSFVVLERTMPKGTTSMISRIETILEELGCSERLIKQLKLGETYSLTAEKTQRINENISCLRRKGHIFLKEAVK